MGGDFHQPIRLDLDHISHVFVSGEDEFVVDDAVGLILVEDRARVDSDIQAILGSFIDSVSMQAGAVHEKTR